jgi:hypothetical protein
MAVAFLGRAFCVPERHIRERSDLATVEAASAMKRCQESCGGMHSPIDKMTDAPGATVGLKGVLT